MYKMIVFDCDGTLLDSSAMIAMIQKGYGSMFPQRKKQPYAFFIPCYYMSDEENLAYLQIPKSCKRQFEELCFGKCGDFSSHTHIFVGIQELLRQLLDDGIALGIATSRNTTAFLELQSMFDADIFSAFSSIGTQDVVKHTKPAPDVLYYIMEQTKQTTKSPVVREYKIGDITYIVKAVVKDGVKEDAATKVRRLIQNDLNREKSPV